MFKYGFNVADFALNKPINHPTQTRQKFQKWLDGLNPIGPAFFLIPRFASLCHPVLTQLLVAIGSLRRSAMFTHQTLKWLWPIGKCQVDPQEFLVFSGSTGKGSNVGAVSNIPTAPEGPSSCWCLLKGSNQLPNWSSDCFFRSSKRCIVQCCELFLARSRFHSPMKTPVSMPVCGCCCEMIRFVVFAIWDGFLKEWLPFGWGDFVDGLWPTVFSQKSSDSAQAESKSQDPCKMQQCSFTNIIDTPKITFEKSVRNCR